VRTILSDDSGRKFESIVNLSRRKRWKRDLIPHANVNNSVGKIDFLDVVDDGLFLQSG